MAAERQVRQGGLQGIQILFYAKVVLGQMERHAEAEAK